jgi:hypothetical protein
MATLAPNTVRDTIESRLLTELNKSPKIPVTFQNSSYRPTANKTWVQCLVSFGKSEYMTPTTTKTSGAIMINVFAAKSKGFGPSLTVGKRIRDLYNRINVSGVYFEPPHGPEVMAKSASEGYFQTQVRLTFETFEEH